MLVECVLHCYCASTVVLSADTANLLAAALQAAGEAGSVIDFVPIDPSRGLQEPAQGLAL